MSKFTLGNFIKENDVVQYGDFTLASGKSTNTYFNSKNLTLNAEGLMRAIPPLLREMLKISNIEAVGGLELGAVPIIGAMLMHSAHCVPGPSKPLKGFIVRKQPKDHGLKTLIEGPVKKGMKCAIVEDVATTGGSALQAIKAAQDFGLEVMVVASIINRQEGADALFEELKIPFVYLITKDTASHIE